MAHRLFRLLVTIWVGSLLTVGFMVAPILFTMLDVGHAGSVAARLFGTEASVSAVCGILTLLFSTRFVRGGEHDYVALRRLVLMMLLCLVLGYFVLQPFMDSWRLAAQQAGVDVGQSVYAARFGALHTAATIFYVLQSLFGIALIWRLPSSTSRWGAARWN